MLVRVLGAVELVAVDGSAVLLPGTRQPALLAALAARSGEVVSTDRLVELLWGDHPPENPEASLHSAVFKLRTRLRSIADRDVLRTRDHGYQLVLQPGDLDADVFDTLVHRARDEEATEAAATLADALALWRGTAYGGFADTDIAYLEALRLEERRRAAVELRAECLIGVGRAAEAVPLLEPFVAEHPLREAARAALMRALHATGRTAEGLDHFQGYRHHLADELGLEPSGAMQSLQLELLQQPTTAADGHDREAPAQRGTARGLTGMRVRYLSTGAGNVIAYGTTGTGPAVVVLLGWISSLDVIASGRDPRSSLLERLTDDLSLTLYDRAGTGLSAGPVTDYGMAASLEELEAVVRAVAPPVSLLAMSAAGPIAVELAARHPDWVTSLVLFGTFANGPDTFTDKRLRDIVLEVSRDHWGLGSKLLADLYRPGSSDDAATHLAKVLRDSAPPDVAVEYLSRAFEYDVSDSLATVRAPALVLHYRGDRLIPFRGAQDLVAGMQDATLLPLDGRVHLPDASDLDLIQRAIVDLVTRHA
ncbi:MAG TPA: BTAD domain-containing putative transcriptional regulator [Nocardioidaceae bacterium]|nr:BTAD domain-containing putative transcriptional regulator [Nocardioidaceae bacterium]